MVHQGVIALQGFLQVPHDFWQGPAQCENGQGLLQGLLSWYPHRGKHPTALPHLAAPTKGPQGPEHRYSEKKIRVAFPQFLEVQGTPPQQSAHPPQWPCASV